MMSTQATIRWSLPTLAGLTILAFASSASAEPGCKPVFDAQAKQAVTPNHQYTTDIGAGDAQPSKGEIIFTATAMYMKADASWQRRDFNPQRAVAELREAATSSHVTCKHIGDEAVGGEAAALYDTRDQQEDGTVVDSKVWISTSRGLPLKQTVDMDLGGKFGKSHNEVRIDYGNVQPPAGVR